jgi:hypothetical protein
MLRSIADLPGGSADPSSRATPGEAIALHDLASPAPDFPEYLFVQFIRHCHCVGKEEGV